MCTYEEELELTGCAREEGDIQCPVVSDGAGFWGRDWGYKVSAPSTWANGSWCSFQVNSGKKKKIRVGTESTEKIDFSPQDQKGHPCLLQCLL